MHTQQTWVKTVHPVKRFYFKHHQEKTENFLETEKQHQLLIKILIKLEDPEIPSSRIKIKHNFWSIFPVQSVGLCILHNKEHSYQQGCLPRPCSACWAQWLCRPGDSSAETTPGAWSRGPCRPWARLRAGSDRNNHKPTLSEKDWCLDFKKNTNKKNPLHSFASNKNWSKIAHRYLGIS